MASINKNNDAQSEAQPVKDIAESVKTVLGTASVKSALADMKAQDTDSSLVTDQHGELLGSVSKDEMNRKVGGLGHDPETEAVDTQLKTNVTDCFEDQTVGEAKQIMLDAKVPEVAVVTREKVLIGTTNLEAIAQDKERKEIDAAGEPGAS